MVSLEFSDLQQVSPISLKHYMVDISLENIWFSLSPIL